MEQILAETKKEFELNIQSLLQEQSVLQDGKAHKGGVGGRKGKAPDNAVRETEWGASALSTTGGTDTREELTG